VSTPQSSQVEVAEGVIDLGVGQPDASVFPVDALRRAADRCFTGEAPDAFLQYGAEHGDGTHRLELATYLTSAYGIPIQPEHLFTTNGNSQALDLVCAVFTRPGDVVIVEEPTYFLALDILADHGLTVVGVPIDDEGIAVDLLESALGEIYEGGRRAGFIYTIPASQNPTGITATAGRRASLVEIANRYRTLVVADEVYQLLSYDGPDIPPMSAWVGHGNVVSLGTFSKILAPGLRLGWVHGTPEVVDRLAASGLVLSGGGLNPATSALVTEVIRSGDLTSHVEFLCAEYRRRVDVMDRTLRATMPEGVTWHRPDGGYFFWLRLPDGTDGAELRRRASLADVDVRQGILFSSQGAQQRFIRLSISYYRDEDIVEGVTRLGGVMSA
jgi:DNA-binding transcriptional MocR family regulator